MPDFTEDQMADVVIAHSEELLGETLTLLGRKKRIGRHELDLIFRDRTGAALIVELQRGTLDSYHQCKVLDYLDVYRGRYQDHRARIMVVGSPVI